MKPSLHVLISVGVFVGIAVADQRPAPAKTDVKFGRDVMPILGQRCFKCHGPDVAQVAAGLRLDTKLGAREAIIDGDPSRSPLMRRVSAKDPSVRMPPPDSGVKPLDAAQIETLRQWIANGAPYERHWSFAPPKMPELPTVKSKDWIKNTIDRFVLAKLESAGLQPEPETDRDTLALRAAQTLTGLPPSPSELASFRRDAKPGAYERYVDRLLAKTEYGEHQARYWLDAVRYADTHGLQLDNERGIFPYRDWVIRAFNTDLPYNKFALWQLAGDLFDRRTVDQLIATGYVRLNLTSNEGGAIEEEFLARNTFDRVDTTSTVFLGLTVACAKCHDHKYDPIKQRDYYGLYALFNSTADKPLDGNIALPPPVIRAPTPAQVVQLDAIKSKIAAIEKTVDVGAAAAYFAKELAPPVKTSGWRISPVYKRGSFDEAFDAAEAPETSKRGTVSWKPINLQDGKDLTNIIRQDSASVYIEGHVDAPAAGRVPILVSSDDAVKVWLNGKLIHAHKVGRALNSATDSVHGDFQKGDNVLLIKVVNSVGPDGLNLRFEDANTKRIRASLAAAAEKRGSADLIDVFLELGPSSTASVTYKGLLKERNAVEASIPMSLIAQELPKPRPTFILKRGEYNQPGEPVERHIPLALGELPAGQARNRLSFANWLTAPTNPLFARVYVNRVWQQHFGVGLVKTVEDFGTQGEWPLNQPLLDFLAVEFQRQGWSIKRLNRLIVTSAAFRQRSRITPAKLTKDPENRLISRGPRFRLDAEVIRDKALFAAGLLAREGGGRGFKPYQPDGIWEGTSDPASQTHYYVRDKDRSIYRRSLYMFWKRTAPPPAMLNFDAPLRDTCICRRSTTNTPLQALTSENEPAFLESARVFAERLLAASTSDDARLRSAFDVAMGRRPRADELTILKRALSAYRLRYRPDAVAATKLVQVGDTPVSKQVPPAEVAAWMIICSTLMNTDEFLTIH